MYFEVLLGLLLIAAIVAVFCSFCFCKGNLRIVTRRPFLCPKHSTAMECPLINQSLDPNMQTLIHCLSHPQITNMEHIGSQDDRQFFTGYWPLQEDPETPKTLSNGHTVWVDPTPFRPYDFTKTKMG